MSRVVDLATSGRFRHRPSLGRQVFALVAFALGLGAFAGVVWWWTVDLPGYLVNPNGRAATTERGLADFIGGDAWFTLLGAVAGLLLGWLGWRRLQRLGWPVVLLVVLSALASALVCWLVGYLLGPSNFNQRLAVARPGDLVLIQLTLRTKASLLVWPFAAAIPVLLGSSLGADEDEPQGADQTRSDQPAPAASNPAGRAGD